MYVLWLNELNLIDHKIGDGLATNSMNVILGITPPDSMTIDRIKHDGGVSYINSYQLSSLG